VFTTGRFTPATIKSAANAGGVSADGVARSGNLPTWTSGWPLVRTRRSPAAAAETLPDEISREPVGGRAKRFIDICIALSTLIVLAPLIALVAAVVRLSLGSPVFYAQTRIGFRGRPFLCYKFRTMQADSERLLFRHLQHDQAAAREWRETQKLRNDPRVTPLGHLLRKSSIDELPQLFNVLRGEMSCVGPRPVPAEELERYAMSARKYKAARPGLTGLWQINGRNRLSYQERIALDRFYVWKWSLVLDLVILLRTIPAVMRVDDTY
jgi:exopolysaccharide production protein ExoY